MNNAEASESWNQKQGPNYLAQVRSRIESVDLAWVAQFSDILQDKFPSARTVKDIGCQAFQFYKELRKRGLPYEYFGYELDSSYVNVGLEFFPELRDNVHVGDFAECPDTKHTDVTICSATLEHIDDWPAFLAKMLRTTGSVVLLRTFLGDTMQRQQAYHPGAAEPYPIWQFSFREFLSEVRRNGFFPEICRDRYTESLPKYLDVLPHGIDRTQYVIVARRIEEPQTVDENGLV